MNYSSLLSPAAIKIATRESPLAMWQANHVANALRTAHPHSSVTLLPMSTRGDQILDRTLAKVGGKGLFVRELENALIEGRADIAVHSLKDVPMDLPEGFALGGVLAREEPRDALVSNQYDHLSALPDDALIGTASLRRSALIRARYPHLRVAPLRGNVGTRLRKLDEGEFAAIVLACAGLIRMGLSSRIRCALSPDEFLPSPAQGAIGLEIRAGDGAIQSAIDPLICPLTTVRVLAERSFARVLQGGCEVPLAAFATINEGTLHLRGWVAQPDGAREIASERQLKLSPDHTIAQSQAETLGRNLAEEFITRGALSLIQNIRQSF